MSAGLMSIIFFNAGCSNLDYSRREDYNLSAETAYRLNVRIEKLERQIKESKSDKEDEIKKFDKRIKNLERAFEFLIEERIPKDYDETIPDKRNRFFVKSN